MPQFQVAATARLHGRLKLARLLEMSEDEFESRLRKIERDPLFRRLRAAGVVSLEPYEGIRHGARRFDGWPARDADDGLGRALDAGSEAVRLIQRLGPESFEAHFLRGEGDDRERARACGLSVEEARLLREFVDRLRIQGEFAPSADAPPPRARSAVAGVEIVDGAPALAFFNREIWKGRYRVHPDKSAWMRESLAPRERRKFERLLRHLEFLDRRKSTLYRILEELLAVQSAFLLSGDRSRRSALTQRDLADRVDASPSVLNRLIAQKSIRLPWGREAPLKELVPSAKSLLLDRVHDLAVENPDASDERLRARLEQATGARLSRRSVAQYRRELGLGGRNARKKRCLSFD